MLILTRKAGESVVICDDHTDVRVTVVEVMSGNQVRLGFDADDDVDIFREEVWDQINQELLDQAPQEVAREKEQGPL